MAELSSEYRQEAPTEAMVLAGRQAYVDWVVSGEYATERLVERIYRAMRDAQAAAPSPTPLALVSN